METNINKVLSQRGKIYGKYEDGVECRAQIMGALKQLYKKCNREDMPESMSVMFSDITLKMMRAVTAPEHIDSWIDLAGYAKLIKETMCKRYDSNS